MSIVNLVKQIKENAPIILRNEWMISDLVICIKTNKTQVDRQAGVNDFTANNLELVKKWDAAFALGEFREVFMTKLTYAETPRGEKKALLAGNGFVLAINTKYTKHFSKTTRFYVLPSSLNVIRIDDGGDVAYVMPYKFDLKHELYGAI